MIFSENITIFAGKYVHGLVIVEKQAFTKKRTVKHELRVQDYFILKHLRE